MKNRCVQAFKVLDLLFPALALAGCFERLTLEVNRPYLSNLTVLIAGILMVPAWFGMVRRERLGFGLFAVIGLWLGWEEISYRGFSGAIAYRPYQDDSMCWWIMLGGLYSVFRIITGGTGEPGSLVEHLSSRRGKVTPGRAIGLTWGAQGLSETEFRIWMVAAVVAGFGFIVDLFFIYRGSAHIAFLVFCFSAPIVAILSIRRAVREIRSGSVRQGSFGIVWTSIALTGLFMMAAYTLAAPKGPTGFASARNFQSVHRTVSDSI